jgi:hypothetical protein
VRIVLTSDKPLTISYFRPADKRCVWAIKTKNHTTDIHELLVSTFATADALSKLFIEKVVITEQEFLAKISEERATYQRMLNSTPQ